MDISDTLAPNSDQLDAVDLLSGPRTFLIERVSKGDEEQPVNIHFAEFPRPWRPGKSMRRVLVACWGADASAYVGRRVQLYCDPDVRFGGAAVGGTRIAALSHIDKAKQVPLLVSRGKSAIFVVQPLADEPAPTRAARPRSTPSAQVALEYRDKALDKDATFDSLGVLYREVTDKHLEGAEVVDGTGDTVALGDLIKARGEEIRRGAS
jgi:hypothetical protein